MCHVLRNAKCSALKATEVWQGREHPVEDRAVGSLHVELGQAQGQEHEQKNPLVPQCPLKKIKKRTGVRPFPPALIARVAMEGKELAKNYGIRGTARILCSRYPLANLSESSVDR